MREVDVVIDNMFHSRIRFSNFLFKALMVATLAQQIYFPQKMKYLHLALLFVMYLLLDLVDESHRNFAREQMFLGLIFSATLVSVVDYMTSIDLSMLYLMILIVSIWRMLLQIRWLGRIVASGDLRCISSNNIRAIEKGPKFIIGLLATISGILIFAIVYSLYEMLIILI